MNFINKIVRSLKRMLINKEEEVVLMRNIEYVGGKKPNITFGQGSYFNGVTIYCWDETIVITIGKYCSFGDKITVIAGGEHDKHWVSNYPLIDVWQMTDLYRFKKQRYKGNINIGNDVWVANNVVLLSGITVGDGAVIGAGSVVTKDVPPYAIMGGNPAKLIRYRFSQDIIEKLLIIRWWDWPEHTIKDNLWLFLQVDDFVNTYYKGQDTGPNSGSGKEGGKMVRGDDQ